MPPIEVYQVGEAYFVADGNHRVSVAIQKGEKMIEASVCEYQAPVGLSAEADLEELLINPNLLSSWKIPGSTSFNQGRRVTRLGQPGLPPWISTVTQQKNGFRRTPDYA